LLADVPWPVGDLAPAVHALSEGDARMCGRLVAAAYGIGDDDGGLFDWWTVSLDRIEERRRRAAARTDPA
jgi:hypothetical protein